MEKWSQKDVTLGAQRGPKGAPKIDYFFGVFLKAAVHWQRLRGGGATVVLSPADPLGRGLFIKEYCTIHRLSLIHI